MGGIGYVEYAYALQNKLAHTKLINSEGTALEPEHRRVPGRRGQCGLEERTRLLSDPDQSARQGHLADHRCDLHSDAQKAGQARTGRKQVLNFFDWAYKNGAEMAKSLQYVPMPPNAVAIFEDSWKQIVGPDGKPVWDGHAS